MSSKIAARRTRAKCPLLRGLPPRASLHAHAVTRGAGPTDLVQFVRYSLHRQPGLHYLCIIHAVIHAPRRICPIYPRPPG